jgi:hypothetical protein
LVRAGAPDRAEYYLQRTDVVATGQRSATIQTAYSPYQVASQIDNAKARLGRLTGDARR